MIRSVPVPARRLITVREEHPIWADCSGAEVGWAGALVRLHPPARASEREVAAVVAYLEGRGAARVAVVARARPPEVVRRIDVDPSPAPRLSHREVVLAVAEEARSSDPAALRALLEGILDEEGV